MSCIANLTCERYLYYAEAIEIYELDCETAFKYVYGVLDD
jgi:hypothetical protein